MERNLVIGKVYRHFKGTLYRITGIGVHTETNEKMVIYQRADGEGNVWVRPYDMFVSEVDHAKYPDVKQKYRFEEVTPKERASSRGGYNPNTKKKPGPKKPIKRPRI